MSSENIIGLLYDMCRLCLERIGRHSVFASVDLPMDIAECAGVQVDEGDGLPETMCEVCVERLHMCRAFRRLAERSDVRLRALHAQARSASESEAEYESIIPEIVMDTSDANIEEETPPIALNTSESKESHEGGVSRITVRSDLFSDQPGTSGEIHKEPKLKRKALTPCDTGITNELQFEGTRLKRRRMAATSKINCTDVEEHPRNETEVQFKKPSLNDEDYLICEICKKECATPKALYLHRRSHIKRYPCAMCEKAFSSKGDLTKHVRIHTGERPYVCDVCGKAFAQNVSLKLHYNVHIKLEFGIAAKKGRPTKTKATSPIKTEESVLTPSETVASNKEKETIETSNDTFRNAYDNIFDAESVHLIDDADKSSSKMVNNDCSDVSEIDLRDDNAIVCANINPIDVIDVPDDTENAENHHRPEECGSNVTVGGNPDDRDIVVNNLVESTFFSRENSNNGVQSDSSLHKQSISKKPYECDICRKKFTYEEKLQKHKTKHEKKMPCVPNETVSAVADSTYDDNIATTTNDCHSDSNDRCLITSTETTEDDGKSVTNPCIEVANMIGANSPNSIGCSDGSKDDSAGDSDSTKTDALEVGISNQKQYQCDTCQKTFPDEKKFQRHQKRHLKRCRKSFSVQRFC